MPLADDAHKGDAGRVLVIAGSSSMPGAAILVARAAQRSGAGLVTVAHLWPGTLGILAEACPEALHLDVSREGDLQGERLPDLLMNFFCDVRVVGPGLTRSNTTCAVVHSLLEDTDFTGPLLLDADALGVLASDVARIAGAKATVVLTPHPGEARGLLGRDIGMGEEDRLAAAQELAHITQATVVLKGRRTVVACGDQVFVCSRGNPGMATAGSGDVLSGIIGALLCRCGSEAGNSEPYTVFDAAVTGVELHGLAGDAQHDALGTASLIASDLIDGLPQAFAALGGAQGC